MNAQTLWVHGFSAWQPAHADRAACARDAGLAPKALPAATLLPARARGRASLLTRMFAETTQHAIARAGIALHEPVLIFGSAFGEVETSLSLLERVVRGEVASPVRFQNGVHSAGVSQVAIHTQNRSFCTSVCAGDETFALALFEAAAWLARHAGFALVAVADECTPALVAPERSFVEAAAALCLGAEPSAGARPITLLGPYARAPHALRARETETASDEIAALPAALVRNPSAWALPCIEALARDRRTEISLDPAGRFRLRV